MQGQGRVERGIYDHSAISLSLGKAPHTSGTREGAAALCEQDSYVAI